MNNYRFLTKKNNKTMKNFFKRVLAVIVVGAVAYLFLSLCNWSLNAGDWNGFSRFLLGCIGLIGAISLFD